MILEKDILNIIKTAKTDGYDVLVRDIAYIIVSNVIENKELVYATMFGREDTPANAAKYEKSKKTTYLRNKLADYLDDNAESSDKPTHQDISFEENKDALIKMLKKINRMASTGKIDAKDAVKLETDIRIKLNDKFDVSTNKVEKRVMVNAKFNHICEITRKECWLQTKEFAMEHWGLVEKNSNGTGDNN